MNKLINLGKVSRETQADVLRCVTPSETRGDSDNTGSGSCSAPTKQCKFVSTAKAPLYPDCI